MLRQRAEPVTKWWRPLATRGDARNEGCITFLGGDGWVFVEMVGKVVSACS